MPSTAAAPGSRDFANDDITISADLYEVILAYQHHLRPGA